MLDRQARLLRTAFVAGAVTDALAVVPLLFPSMAQLLWGFEDVGGACSRPGRCRRCYSPSS